MSSNHFKGTKGQVINDRYKIVKFICEGGYSMVYLCQDLVKNSQVAIKIVRADPKYSSAANNEIELMKKINTIPDVENKHLCMYISDFIFPTTNGFYHVAIVMEALGMSLYEYFARDMEFTVTQTKKLTKQLLIAVEALHDNLHMIHADLKPANIMFVGDPQDCKIKLADFGNMIRIKETEEWLVSDPGKIQTRKYRSPESIIGSRYSEVTDVWSIGCIVYEMLAGIPLFDPRGRDEGDALYEEYIPRLNNDGDRDDDHLCQMKCILDDEFRSEIIDLSFWRYDFFENEYGKLALETRGIPTEDILKKLLKSVLETDEEVYDVYGFLQYCLRINPQHRLKPKSLLETDFIT